jgi:hypothetical protein
MIGPEFLLFSNRSKDSNIFYDLLLLILIVPMLGQITTYLKDHIPKYMNKLYNKFSNQSVIEFVGYDKLDYGEFIPTYPEAMLSVFRWTIHQKKVKSLRYYNKQKGLWEKSRDEGLTDLNYMIVEGKNIELEEGLYMDVEHQKLEDPNLKKTVDVKTNKLTLNLRAALHNTDYINKFVNKCIKFNREYELGLNKNKLYHFTFKGYDSNYNFNECFHISILKEYDYDDKKISINKSKPFANLFFDNKEKLIKRLEKLKDYEYYKRTGSPRKVGLLFYGPPGCGKTKSVREIAEEYKRHIIEVPMSRIKKNSDIEELFNLTKIGCTEFKKEDIIFLFDEIDQLGKILHDRNTDSGKKESDKYVRKREEEKDKSENSEDNKEDGLTKVIKEYMSIDSCKPNGDDSINLGSLLSRLDGIGNYDGLITIATTNCIEKLDSALKRPGRLDPYLFDYANKSNIIDIIEKFLQVKLSEEQIQRLPDRDSSLSHTTIIKLTQDYEDDLEGLITVLETYKKS